MKNLNNFPIFMDGSNMNVYENTLKLNLKQIFFNVT